MPDGRRFDAAEIERIFAIAAAEGPSPSSGSPPTGLTLSELQSIGREVGISPEHVAEAAASLDRGRALPERARMVGIPLGVQRLFDLPRKPTDREWSMLVAEARRIFSAQGKVSSAGELWEWRNGNLVAAIEPSADGYQLRLSTRKGSAPFYGALGAGWLLVSFGIFVDGEVVGGIMSLLVSLGFLSSIFRLPQWAALRESQMESIGRQAVDMLRIPVGDAQARPAVDAEKPFNH